MKTLQLDIEYNYDFEVYGLVSHEKEYKLAWMLNNLFRLHLVKKQDLCHDLIGKGRLIISNFEYITEHGMARLFQNKARATHTLIKPFLLPDMKEYDYVLQIKGLLQHLHPQELGSKLLRSPLVQYVKQFDPHTLKFKENLLF
ncbi:IPExxxVDY family protein [Pontibacter chitinilyticus]|uniref:IPExxxVDY family protein n=1 Tax=Pontibacter chitinilyticus TaxID=2674989 RepID=UPI00321C154C